MTEPITATTTADLDEVPVGGVVRDGEKWLWLKAADDDGDHPGGEWQCGGAYGRPQPAAKLIEMGWGPFHVLYPLAAAYTAGQVEDRQPYQGPTTDLVMAGHDMSAAPHYPGPGKWCEACPIPKPDETKEAPEPVCVCAVLPWRVFWGPRPTPHPDCPAHRVAGTCPSCGSPDRLTVRPPCSLDQFDPDGWHRERAAAEGVPADA